MQTNSALQRGKQRVVILGGGFAGVYAALELEGRIGGKDDIEVILVSKQNYFVFHPMLAEVISGQIGLTDVVSPLRRLLKKTEIQVREIEAIDLERKVVRLAPGFKPHAHELEYDHLILGLGTVTDFRGLRGLPEHALPFKDLSDALHLRHHVIRALEEAAIEKDDRELRQQLLTFVVAGGGFSGVEVVAELNDFVRQVARTYRGIYEKEIRVILVQAMDRILPEVGESLGKFALDILRTRGVEVMLDTRIEAATGTEAILSGDVRLPTRTLVSTVPSFPHPLIDTLTTLPKSNRGRVIVDSQLAVPGHKGVWALGDCAQVKNPDGSENPPTAQHATRQATALAANLVTSIRGGSPRIFDFKGLGKMGSLGHRSAVAEVFGVKLSGFVAWLMWRAIYLMKLPGLGRRAKVLMSWTFDLILAPDLVQLQFDPPPLLRAEHYEDGQFVFRQGDLGDRVYMIRKGEAEVIQEGEDGEKILATLGPGECFGEMGVLGKKARSATVRCKGSLDTVALPQKDFATLAENLPDLRQGFERVAKARQAVAAPKAD